MLVKVLAPEKKFESARRVEDAVPVIAPQVTLPEAETLSALEPVQLPVATNRLEVEAVVKVPLVEKRLVVVALVPVAVVKVKLWRVEEPVARKLTPVTAPVEVRLPPKAVPYESVVAKELVVVALVVVEFNVVM